MGHATVEQLEEYVSPGTTLPADTGRLLDRASTLIDRATVAAVYNPADAAVQQAFADATCAQVEWWLETGDEHGQTAGLTSVTQGAARLEGRFARLAPRAVDTLAAAGLTPRPVSA